MGTPALIVADEPTTALDVTVQQQVLDLLRSIRDADDVALVLISHDVTVVAEVCDRVIVMYAGRIVEDLPAAELHTAARHPYTRALVAAVPDMDADLDRPMAVIAGRPVDPADVPAGVPCRQVPARVRPGAAPTTRRWLPTPPDGGSLAGTPASRSALRCYAPTRWASPARRRSRERAEVRQRDRPLRAVRRPSTA